MENPPRDKRNREITRHGPVILRWVIFNTILLVLAVVGSNYSRYLQVKRVEDAAIVARTKSEIMEQQLLDYMERTVQRWDALQMLNPQLEVPRATEPQPPGKTSLTDAELHRPTSQRPPKLNPTPTVTPPAKPHTHLKHKAPPSPRPWYNFFKATR